MTLQQQIPDIASTISRSNMCSTLV